MPLWKRFRKLVLYIAVISVIKLFIEVHHFSLLTYITLSSIFIIPELLSEYRPQFMGYIIARRESQIYTVLGISLFCAAGFYFNFPFPPNFFDDSLHAAKSIFATMLQGASLGLVSRMLFIHLSYQLVKLRDVFFSKILILIVYTVFLVFLPFENMHQTAPFFLGYAAGFAVHYMSRYSERRHASIGRLQQNLRSMIEDMTHAVNFQLTAVEEKAVHLFSREKWASLKKVLGTPKETVTLFFIMLCMYRKLHLFDAALHQLSEKERTHPEWYQAHKNYFLLHRALNNNEKTLQGDDQQLNEKILEDLRRGVQLDNTCMLSHAVLAQKLADKIDLDTSDPKIIEENEVFKKEATCHIQRAMDIYENREKEKRLLSILTGLTIPCTYSFLLDIYGYVLLKNGKLKFAKVQLSTCIHLDPSFSSTYVHMAEWYKEYYKNSHSEDVEWKKAARLCLYIALNIEELESKNGSVSYITKKARSILQTL
jgi:hypothetical protein